MRATAKRLLASNDDGIQSTAASCLVFLNQIDAAEEDDYPPIGPPSREASNLGRFPLESEESGSSNGGTNSEKSHSYVTKNVKYSRALTFQNFSPGGTGGSPVGAKQGSAGMVWGTGGADKSSSPLDSLDKDVAKEHWRRGFMPKGRPGESPQSLGSVASDCSRRSDSYDSSKLSGDRNSVNAESKKHADLGRQTSRVFDSNIQQRDNRDHNTDMQHTGPEHASGDASANSSDTFPEARRSLGTKHECSKLRWQLGPCLGKGAFAEVYQGINTETGKFLAVKQVKLKHEAKAAARALQREIDLLCELPDNQHVVKYLGTEHTEDDKRLFIFLEYVSGGSVQDMLSKFGALDEHIVRTYTNQVLKGLAFLHMHNVVHCDVKGGNILVSEDGVIKLADFNSSKLLGGISWGGDAPLRSIAGTPQFMAPEVIRQTGHGAKADIWSVGCTVIQMLTAAAPWNEISNTHVILRQVGTGRVRPAFPAGISADCVSFLDQCFQLDPDCRPDAETLLQHPFVANCH